MIPSVAVRLYRPVALALEARGVSSDAIFAEFGVPPPRTCGWEERVPLPQIATLWDRLLEVTGDPEFALHAAGHVDLTTCDVITYLEANAGSLRAALESKLKYLALMTNAVTWTLDVEGDEARLTLHEVPPRPPLAPVAEYLIGARHMFLGQFGPADWALRALTFRHDAPQDTQQHQQTFGVLPRFGAAHDQLVFAAALLDAPMRNREDALADLLTRYADHALSTVTHDGGLSARVRDLLRSGVDPGVGEVSRRLGMSVRALQRALSAEQTTYQNLSNEMRRSAAERLLSRRELAIAETAYTLGFANVPAFHRAFVRWTGLTPGEFRLRALGSAAEPTLGRLDLHHRAWPSSVRGQA